jgi:KDO2-lipid IV(A) lauroyltransferase
MMMRLDKKHRNQTYANLHLAFPELTESQILSLGTRTYEHFGRLIADFLRSRLRTDEQVLATTTAEGMDYAHEAIAQDKGVLALTAHFGNWERFARYGTANGIKLTVVARDVDDQGFQQKVLEFRETTGIEVLSRGNAARSILAALKQKKIVGILPDQNTDECFVPFFGHPCGTVLGPAVLHQRSKAPLLPVYCVRTGVGQYHTIVKPSLVTEGMTPENIASEMNAVLEGVIRQYPEQYLWLHDRWRSAKRRGLVPIKG